MYICLWSTGFVFERAFLTLIGLVTLSYSNCLVLEQPTEEVLTVKMLLFLPTLFTILGLGYQIYYNHDLRARTHTTLNSAIIAKALFDNTAHLS